MSIKPYLFEVVEMKDKKRDDAVWTIISKMQGFAMVIIVA